MSTMLIPASPSASASCATMPGPVRHRHAQLAHRAARELALQQPLAVRARLLDPALERLGVARAQALAHRRRAPST